MGLCSSKPDIVFLVYRQGNNLLCTYDIHKARAVAKVTANAVIVAHYPDGGILEPSVCI